MPLNGAQYLESYGWEGKGRPLRAGAITRAPPVAQKKSFAGVGKDRDEAFPFWEHLFTAAAKTIRIKLTDNDDGLASHQPPSSTSFAKTSTGILSNQRPTHALPAIAPTEPSTSSGLSLMAVAKREAARQSLYARFFRGPTLVDPVSDDRKEGSDRQEPPLNDRSPGHEDNDKALRRPKRRRVEESAALGDTGRPLSPSLEHQEEQARVARKIHRQALREAKRLKRAARYLEARS